MNKLYWDSETCGLHSMPVLLQYAVNDGPIELYDIWFKPIGETLKLLEWYTEHCVVGFNLVFDQFHVCKLYTIFRLLPHDWIPIEHIEEIAAIEAKGQDGPCVKPASALDLLLHSRKTKFQSLMARDDIRIRRVPTGLAEALRDELEARLEIDGIYFAKSADPNAPRWKCYPVKHKDGLVDPHFQDVCLKFHPAGGLKFLAEYALGYKPAYKYTDIEPITRPLEFGYAPTALAVSTPEQNWAVHDADGKLLGHAWPALIRQHAEHWRDKLDSRKYAEDDILYTRELDKYFGYPEPGDDDSVLACMVAAVRWKGFKIDIDKVKDRMADAQAIIDASSVDVNKTRQVRDYLNAVMDDTEKVMIEETTKKAKVESIAKWEIEEEDDDDDDKQDNSRLTSVMGWKFDNAEPCEKCNGENPQCERCGGKGRLDLGPHPAAIRAKEILKVKGAQKDRDMYRKLLKAGKFHIDLSIIGTRSSRMAGTGGLNGQAIRRDPAVRALFNLADAAKGERLGIGDFESFEVCILDSLLPQDGKLHEMLTSGVSIHATFGTYLYKWPDGRYYTYDEIIATKKMQDNKYAISKNCFFGGICYGGNEHTLITKYWIDKNIAPIALERFYKLLPDIAKWRNDITERFCSLKQPEGIGSRVVWTEPDNSISSLLGFSRDFTLENMCSRVLYDLANKPPKHWKECKQRVVRRDRIQGAAGATQSALYSASFQIQAANSRQAANHQIQSTGAQVTKTVERRVYDDFQPAGIHDWKIVLSQIHDEIFAVHKPEISDQIGERIQFHIASFKPIVPLLAMEWKKDCSSWADK